MSAQPKDNQGIAIIGMAGRFPKAKDITEFWQNMSAGVEGISFFTDEELEAAGADFPKGNPHYVKARGLLEGADLFDATFFGVNPREAEIMDPQHRIFLECAWEALENAGCNPAKFDGAIGVFAGASMNTYLGHNLFSHPELIAQLNEHQLMLGNDKDFLTTRVSYKLNLHGPSLNIQTACSTSLVAVCVACQNLLSHECDVALAGGVSVTFPQKRGHLYQEGGIASSDGHCRAFDAKAAGTVAGEGVGIVVLKRLKDALADNDTIYAVIKGFALNNDGANKIGYTAPSVEGQAEAIATAQAMAGFAPETIGYVETHGTGTPLGDPIEIEGLTKAFRVGESESSLKRTDGGAGARDTKKRNFCAIGSVKSNIGHLDTAAGVAGLIKTVLALHHGQIPPSLHFESPNPKIDFIDGPFHVNTKLTEWQNGLMPRRAGVSSFGIGGTNAHVVLEEAPAADDQTASRPMQLLVLSAKSEAALGQASTNLAEYLKRSPAVDLADVAYTLQTGRQQLTHRSACVCGKLEDAVKIFENKDAQRAFMGLADQDNPPVVFMFPGQGAQQVNMARELYEHERIFREQMDLCCEILKPQLGIDLREVVYPHLDGNQDGGKASEKSKESAAARLKQTAITQPALFVIEYALAKLWMSWGVCPKAMIGHSVGEYVAACLAGVFSLEDALALIAARGRLMQQLPGGTMLAVRLSEREAGVFLDDGISLAAVNSPSLCVVSGPADPLEKLRVEMTNNGVACTPLATSHAFHSAMMEPVLQPFTDLVAQVKLNAPKIPFISNASGTWISAEEAIDPGYWARHLRQTVRFADGVGELLKMSGAILLEAGPGHTLANLAKQHPARGADRVVIPSLSSPKDAVADIENILNALGRLWLSGVEIDWKNFYRNERRQRIPLPTYPFERKRYFIEPARASGSVTAITTETRKLGGKEALTTSQHMTGPTLPVKETQTLAALRELLASLSGLNPSVISPNATFVEMGCESLFLTQFSVALEKKFGITVAFRQLLRELSTLDALAAYLDAANRRSEGAHTKDFEPPSSKLEIELARSNAASIALTESQRELWFASQVSDAASSAYNECRLLHLRGDLKENTLVAAIQSLVERHEALRTIFPPGGDFQQVRPPQKLDVPLLDWSRQPEEAQASRLDALQREEARLPFELAAGPLMRAWLIRLDEQHHVLVLTIHHIVCDGYSLGILLRELAEVYSAAAHGVQQELSAPPQWSQYVRRQVLNPHRSESDEQFWLNQFSDSTPVLELPTDHSRLPVRTFEGASESRQLLATLGAELKNVGTRCGGTLFTTLLAAYALLLQKLSGQNEVVVGVPIADRTMEGGESLVGHCINFVPVRLKFEAEETFETDLARAQKVFLEAYEHQGFAYGSLIQRLNLPREANRAPLVSVTFNTQHLGRELKFFGLKTELMANPYAFTHFDLGFNITEMGDTVQLDCRYNSNLYTQETIQRWLGHYQMLLENIAINPQQKNSELSLLSAIERQRILNVWSGAQRDFPADKCIHQLFEEQAVRTPEAIALTLGDRQMTYADLDQRADKLARRLSRWGVGPEVMVALCLERSMEMVIAILAVLKAGGAYVPLEPSWPMDRRVFAMKDAHVPVLVTQRSLSDPFKREGADFKVICVDEDVDSRDAGPTERARTEVRPDNLAYVIYTSGSTGQPKGVMVTHRNVVRLFQATAQWYQFGRKDVWTLFHSYAFDFSVWEIWGALIYGGRLVIVPYLTSRSPATFLKLLAQERVTVLNQTPSAFQQLIRMGAQMSEPIQQSLHFVIFGGEALEMQSLRPWFDQHGDQHPHLVNMYGITETTVHVTYRPIGRADVDAGSVIGVPIPDLQIYILDANLQPVPIGVTGELYVGGAGVARGYLNRPELTAERFIPNPFSAQSDERLYKTGDLARWRAGGDIEYLGRADDQVKIRGHRIELGEIESVLAGHPAVRGCVVLAREDTPGDKRLVAYVVTDPDKASITVGDLREFLKAGLPEYMVPAAFVFLDELPLTVNGKLDRKLLPPPGQTRMEPDESFIAPQTSTEIVIAKIWCETMRLERAGLHDNFFDLGGHSLLMTQIITRLREVFQVELPMRNFFETPTVAGLSAQVEELLADEISRLSDEEADRLAHSPE